MCVGFWSLTHPDYALILFANRDENLARPTLPAHFHSFESLTTPAPSNDTIPVVQDDFKSKLKVLSGRDIRAEGTWLGISQSTGRVALLTNITESSASYTSSRGTLVSAFLADPRGDSDLASATTALTAEDTSYAGFNLLLLEPHPCLPTTGSDTATLAYDARLLTNHGGGGHIRARTLSDDECACGGISNGIDGQGGDVWPKVLQGRAALRDILDEGPADGPKIADADAHLAERLMELLTARSPNSPPRERGELKNIILVPPLTLSNTSTSSTTDADVPPPSDLYGTRLGQVVLVRRDGRVMYIERDIWALDSTGAAVRASPENTRSFTFELGSNW